MYMQPLDWLIVGFVLIVVVIIVNWVKPYVSGVSDFLAGNRMAGRYLLTVAGEVGALGAITIIARWEAIYNAGWGAGWWRCLGQPFAILMMLSGWVIYRYRQTRTLTLAQFFEKRYSRRFRIASGLVAVVAGTINYAIFPSVGARFLMYVCGIPDYMISLGGLPVSLSYAVIIALLLGMGLWVTLRGGQVGIMMSDAIQSIIVLFLILVVAGYMLHTISWNQIAEALNSAPNPETQSMINPFKTSKTRDFNIWFYAIAIFGSFYARMAWQETSGFNSAAKSPHEARMAGVLGIFRSNILIMIMGLFAICAYTVMHHPAFSDLAQIARDRLVQITNPAILTQMTVPIAIGTMLPVGLLGCLVTIIVTLAVTTDSSSLHSWGSIFIQDVIMPFRKKPFTPKAHMNALRWSICGVALFAYFFSLFFRQTGYILMFLAITGSIFIAGAGAAIIGGLYWKRGTTGGAWAALIAGAVLSVSSILIQQKPFHNLEFGIEVPGAAAVTVNNLPAVPRGSSWVCKVPFWRHEEWQGFRIDISQADGSQANGVVYYSYGKKKPSVPSPDAIWPESMSSVHLKISPGQSIPVGTSFREQAYYRIRSINGQWMWLFSMLTSILLYVTVSLLGRKTHDLDRLLHRGKYQTDDVKDKKPVRGWRALIGINSEFTKRDKIIYYGAIIWSYGWVITNLAVLVINLIHVRSNSFWMAYFKVQIWLYISLSILTLVWFGGGAILNSIELLRNLSAYSRNTADDGWVKKPDEDQ